MEIPKIVYDTLNLETILRGKEFLLNGDSEQVIKFYEEYIDILKTMPKDHPTRNRRTNLTEAINTLSNILTYNARIDEFITKYGFYSLDYMEKIIALIDEKNNINYELEEIGAVYKNNNEGYDIQFSIIISELKEKLKRIDKQIEAL